MSQSHISDAVRMEQYLGVWAMQPDRLEQMVAHVRGINLTAHIKQAQESMTAPGFESPPLFVKDGNVAVIQAEGTITKHGSSLSPFQGTVRMRQALRAAVHDDSIGGIMIAMDSPGGNVAGVTDLAAEVRRTAASKPVAVHAEDTMASAAYWFGVQATRVSASPGTAVGSIGVYAIIEDWSALYAESGVQPIIVKSGKFKGAGAKGVKIDDEQLDVLQADVDSVADLFIADVVKGTGLSASKVRALADGRVHLAAAARDLDLIDAVEDFDTAMRKLRSLARPSRSAKTAAARLKVATLT